MSSNVDVVMGPTSDVPQLNTMYFGEVITSMRQVLKRSVTCYFWDHQDGTTPSNFAWINIPHFPHVFISISSPGLALTSRPNVFQYVSSAFVCMRGSTRVKVVEGKQIPGGDTWVCSRISKYLSPTAGMFNISESTTTPRYKVLEWSGSAVDSTRNKPYPEFELPYYSNLRFTTPRSRDANRVDNFIDNSWYSIERCGVSASQWNTLNYSVGEDFSLSFFLSTPVLNFV
jgi:hypothetical protein